MPAKTHVASAVSFPRSGQKPVLKLNSSHIQYVFDCIDRNTTKVRNIKSYLLTTLYNARHHRPLLPRRVNHDLYGGRIEHTSRFYAQNNERAFQMKRPLAYITAPGRK